jgi:hypothetical protein
MPPIATIAGVRIAIWPRSHLPPCLHATYGGMEGKISIMTGDLLEGRLPLARLALVREWLTHNRTHAAWLWRDNERQNEEARAAS